MEPSQELPIIIQEDWTHQDQFSQAPSPERTMETMETYEGDLETQSIPTEWYRAMTIRIPKEQEYSTIGQFQSNALLNVENKIFFSVIAKRLTKFLL